MTAVISMLRGVNVGANHRMKMEDLRAVYESVGVMRPQTYVQSGNVIFASKERNLEKLARRLETAIEERFGFHSDVILRTASELRAVIARNPFADREGLHPGKLLVTFLAGEPGAEAREKLLAIQAEPEELHVHERELYIYFPDGMGKSKLPAVLTARTKKTPGTARNWTSVTKMLEMAERLEAALSER